MGDGRENRDSRLATTFRRVRASQPQDSLHNQVRKPNVASMNAVAVGEIMNTSSMPSCPPRMLSLPSKNCRSIQAVPIRLVVICPVKLTAERLRTSRNEIGRPCIE
jgi:hypothetical protein